MIDGIGKPPDNAKRAADIGQQALAITDHGTLAGSYEFQKACLVNGVKPIIGNEMYLCNDMNEAPLSNAEKAIMTKDQIKEVQSKRARSSHLLVLAMNDKGMENLYTLNYQANKFGFYYRPRIDLDMLEKHSEGLVVTSTCIASKMGRSFFDGDYKAMQNYFERMTSMFGERFFLEIQPNELQMQIDYNEYIINNFAKKYDVGTVITCDAHYPIKEGNDARTFLLSLTTDMEESECKNMFIMPEENVRELWKIHGHQDVMGTKWLDEGIETTKKVATMCNGLIDTESLKEPTFVTPEGYKNNREFINKALINGIQKKIKLGQVTTENAKDYMLRAKNEIEVIDDKGYVDYFLITKDFTDWAYEHDILMSPGRGSAAGSVVCWLLDITQLDPIKYDLFFERFMNPERIKVPDIDNDFEAGRRREVRDYVAGKWGFDNIAPVGSIMRYTCNNLFREYCKNLGMDFFEVNKIAKTINSTGSEFKSLKAFADVAKDNEKLAAYLAQFEQDDKNKLIETISAIEGNPKTYSVSGGGTIISSDVLYKSMPLRRAKLNKEDEEIAKNTNEEVIKMVTEWQVEELGKIGFLKIDMLGIKTLDVVKRVAEQVGISIDDLYSMPMMREDIDPEDTEYMKYYDKAYEMLSQGKTEGIFQFEGDNITRLLKDICPRNVEDLAVTSALYRPGVIKAGLTQKYAKRRLGKEESTNDVHPFFDEILAPTENIMVYQEQFIRMFNKMGMGLGPADLLRRACEHFDYEQIDDLLDNHLFNNDDLKLPVKDVKKITKYMIDNAGYLFNKPHSVSYGMLSYWGAYMKARYPALFCEVLLNYNQGIQEKIASYINMARELLPDAKVSIGSINNFSENFKVNETDILIGIVNVKGIGHKVVSKINEHKPEKGWETFLEFYKDNMDHRMASNKNISIMAILGMFDNMPFSDKVDNIGRKPLSQIVILFDKFTRLKVVERREIFKKCGFEDKKMKPIMLMESDKFKKFFSEVGVYFNDDFNEKETIKLELEYLGFRYSGSERTAELEEALRGIGIPHISEWDAISHEDSTYVWGTIQNVDHRTTKNGKPFAILKFNGNISVKIWENKLRYFIDDLFAGALILLKLKEDSFGLSVAWDRMSLLTEKDIMEKMNE
jgi:DNA polymerase-3 subunit alpha